MTLPPSRYDEVHEKWRGWLDPVQPHVLDLFHNREIWREIRDALTEGAPDDSDTFLRHYTKLYVDAAAIAVRRLADPRATKRNSRSIGQLIADIENQPDVMTQARWVNLGESTDTRPGAEKSMRQILSRNYEKEFGDGEGLLDVSRVTSDLATLGAQSESVAQFASRMIAHIDRRGLEAMPTFDDLDAAIDTVGAMFRRYALLVTGSSWLGLAPVIQHDWKAPLRRPLFAPLDTPPTPRLMSSRITRATV